LCVQVQALLLDASVLLPTRPDTHTPEWALYKECPKQRRRPKNSDRWANSGGQKGSRDLPYKCQHPFVRRRYGTVTCLAAAQGDDDAAVTTKRYYEYTLLMHDPSTGGSVVEDKMRTIFHVLPPNATTDRGLRDKVASNTKQTKAAAAAAADKLLEQAGGRGRSGTGELRYAGGTRPPKRRRRVSAAAAPAPPATAAAHGQGLELARRTQAAEASSLSHGGGGGGGGGRPGPGPGPGPRPVGVVDRELVSSHEQADGPFAHGLPLDYGGGGRRRTAAAGRGAGGHHRLRRPPATDHSLAVLTDSTTTHTKHMEDIDDAPGLHSSIHIHDGGGVTTMTTMMAAVPPRSGAHASASTSPRAAAGAISMGGSGPWGGPQRERRRRRRRQQQQQQQPSALGARRLPSPQVTMEARAPAVLTDCLADWLAGMTGMTGMRRRLPPRQHRVACHG
jgi:hypothetical protein